MPYIDREIFGIKNDVALWVLEFADFFALVRTPACH